MHANKHVLPEWLKYFPDNLRTLMKKHNETQEKLAEELDVSQGLIGNYVTRKKAPGARVLAKISEHYGISIDTLLAPDINSAVNNRQLLTKHSDILPLFQIPLLEYNKISPFLSGQEVQVTRTVYTHLEQHKGKKMFSIIVTTRTMANYIMPGDRIVINPTETPRDNSIVLIKVDGQYSLRQFYRDEGKTFLKAANSDFPLIIKENYDRDIAIVGEAAELYKELIKVN